MKKLFVLIGILLLILPLTGSWKRSTNFVTTGFALAAGATKVIGDTGFTDNKLGTTDASIGLLTVTFTRAAGSTSTVDYYFQVSYDGGTTWSDYIESIGIATNHSVMSGTTVIVSKPVNLFGVSHIRWSKVVNGDVVNAVTAVNAVLSI
jgi:hypothetical protein